MSQHSNPILAEKRALAAEIERYCAARSIKPTTFGRLAGLGGDFFGRLGRDDLSHRWETFQKARTYIEDNPVKEAERAAQ